MSYQPNFTDPRIVRRIQQALDWCDVYVKRQHGSWLSTREIQRQFGSLGRPLGKYLKETLLICTNPYYNNFTGQCKQYKLNENGYFYLCKSINHKPKYQPTDDLINELKTSNFTYELKSNREYHPLQFLPRRIKCELFPRYGFKHEYDISACAQTLLLQHARQLGLSKATPTLDAYLNNKNLVRESLVWELGLDKSTIKKILNAILNGASIKCWYNNHIYALVDYNSLMMRELRENHFIKLYQRDVREMWKEIRKTQTLGYKERFNAKMKSGIYRDLEKQVRVVIQRYLRKTNNEAFVEHDGWKCKRAVDTNRLCFEVKQQTGFVIELEWTMYE